MILNLIFLAIAVIIWIYIFFILDIKNNYIIFSIIILAMFVPGIKIRGNLINPCDLAIPLIFFKIFLESRDNKKIVDRTLIILVIYILILFISIIIASIRIENFDIIAILKLIRIAYIPMVYYITLKKFEIRNFNSILKIFIMSGIICSILGILIFLNQKTIYNPTETMEFGGKLIYRAGGVFGEATTFGNMMFINIILSILCIFNKIFKTKKYCYLNIFLSLIGVVLSYSRMIFISLIIISIFIFIKYKKFRFKNIIIFLLIMIISMYLLNEYKFINKFIYSRIYSVFNLNSNNVNAVSSGRIEIWKYEIRALLSNFNNIFLGIGYKIKSVNTGTLGFADNNFIDSLVQTGIIGFLTFILLNISILKNIIKEKLKSNNKYSFLRDVSIFLWLGVIIQMFTSDTFTFYRNMMCIFIILAMRKSFYKKINFTMEKV